MCWKGFGSHLNQTDKWAAEVWDVSPAAIHDGPCSHNNSSMSPDNIDGFLDTATPCDDILRYQEAFSRGNGKSTEDESSGTIFLDEYVTGVQMTSHLLADDYAPDCWRNHGRFPFLGFDAEGTQFLSQLTTDTRCNRRILKQERALEKLTTVQSGAEDEMAVKQGSRLFEKGQNIAHGL